MAYKINSGPQESTIRRDGAFRLRRTATRVQQPGTGKRDAHVGGEACGVAETERRALQHEPMQERDDHPGAPVGVEPGGHGPGVLPCRSASAMPNRTCSKPATARSRSPSWVSNSPHAWTAQEFVHRQGATGGVDGVLAADRIDRRGDQARHRDIGSIYEFLDGIEDDPGTRHRRSRG